MCACWTAALSSLRQPHFGKLQDNLDQNMREITSRIRILCKLDIAERRRPQDGSFQVSVNRAGSKVTIDLYLEGFDEARRARIRALARAASESQDYKEGTRAFLEKRPPKFQGR